MKPNIKKLLILNAPYLLFVWLFMKIGEAFRLSPGADLSGKLLHIMEGVTAAFESPMPSLNGQDFLIGVAGAVIMRLAVYLKGKNAKKYRKGVEYGSARWGNAKDIELKMPPATLCQAHYISIPAVSAKICFLPISSFCFSSGNRLKKLS